MEDVDFESGKESSKRIDCGDKKKGIYEAWIIYLLRWTKIALSGIKFPGSQSR